MKACSLEAQPSGKSKLCQATHKPCPNRSTHTHTQLSTHIHACTHTLTYKHRHTHMHEQVYTYSYACTYLPEASKGPSKKKPSHFTNVLFSSTRPNPLPPPWISNGANKGSRLFLLGPISLLHVFLLFRK